jgi:predicted transcriptional regulator
MVHPSYGVHVSVRVRPELVDRLDRLATKAGLSRSQFLRIVLGRVNEQSLPAGLADVGAELAASRTVRP